MMSALDHHEWVSRALLTIDPTRLLIGFLDTRDVAYAKSQKKGQSGETHCYI